MVDAKELANVIEKVVDALDSEAFKGFEEYDGETMGCYALSVDERVFVTVNAAYDDWTTSKTFEVTVKEYAPVTNTFTP